MGVERRELQIETVMLGLTPYVLIEADRDDEDDIVFKLRAGGAEWDADSLRTVLLMFIDPDAPEQAEKP